MSTLKKYNLAGKETGHVSIDKQFSSAEANSQMVKDYIIALRANARQWSANTKTRSEVNHTTKKPHPQKGTGRARQGMLSAPQYKGGGRVHGPKPKFDQNIKINKKERRAAIRYLISQKLKDHKIHVIENTEIDAPKTKTLTSLIKHFNIKGRVLFLGEGTFLDLSTEEGPVRFSMPLDKHEYFVNSLRNIPKAEFALATNVSGYDLMRAHDIVVTEAAWKELTEWLC